MKLGFAVQVLGRSGLKASDTRRWQNNPHLSVSLAYLHDVFAYLRQIDVRMYRMSSSLAPYVTHPAPRPICSGKFVRTPATLSLVYLPFKD